MMRYFRTILHSSLTLLSFYIFEKLSLRLFTSIVVRLLMSSNMSMLSLAFLLIISPMMVLGKEWRTSPFGFEYVFFSGEGDEGDYHGVAQEKCRKLGGQLIQPSTPFINDWLHNMTTTGMRYLDSYNNLISLL